jgi:hypothetical protein
MSITVIYHAMSLTVLYQYHQDEWYVYHSDLSCYVSDCTVSVSCYVSDCTVSVSCYVSDCTVSVSCYISDCTLSVSCYVSDCTVAEKLLTWYKTTFIHSL